MKPKYGIPLITAIVDAIFIYVANAYHAPVGGGMIVVGLLNYIMGMYWQREESDNNFYRIRNEVYNLLPKMEETKREKINHLLWNPYKYFLENGKKSN